MTELDPIEYLRMQEFVIAYDAWQAAKKQADIDGDWLRIAPLYDAMLQARDELVIR